MFLMLADTQNPTAVCPESGEKLHVQCDAAAYGVSIKQKILRRIAIPAAVRVMVSDTNKPHAISRVLDTSIGRAILETSKTGVDKAR